MSTESQIQANKLNAQKSTGPKTPQGKAKVSQNAVTHGLTSHRPVLDMEDTAEFRTFVNELLDQLDPTNPLEFFFAKRAVCQAWRIQRAQSYETLVLDNLINNVGQASPLGKDSDKKEDQKDKDKTDDDKLRTRRTKITNYIDVDPSLFNDDQKDEKSILGQVIMDDFRNHWTLDKIARYETRLENSMIRCLGKFQKLRETKMMNFTSLRQYYREFQPRPQDFQDTPAPKKTNGVAQPPSAVIHETDITKLTMSAPNGHPESPTAGEGPADSSQPDDSQVSTNNTSAQPDDSIYSQIENDPNALPMDSFKHWKILHCAPRGENIDIDDGLKIPAVQHRPDVPEEDEFIFRKDWQHRVLDMVEYPWKKRHNLTEAELNELVDSIIGGFPNPTQFLWDFNLIELTAAASAKRRLPALAG
jgi:hypothetical protein